MEGRAASRALAFDAERTRLLAVAYRMTGSFADAEDAVQDAWLRFAEADEVREPAAWLTTVVSRLCLDRLKSAQVRRETYVGTWLPEPIVTGHAGLSSAAQPSDPADAVVRDEDARFAAMVVLDRLPPDQRVAFVLHDAFDLPFAQIAEVLDVTAANARQLATRARKTVRTSPSPQSSAAEHADAVSQLLLAVQAGDLDGVIAMLHPDVEFYGDSGGLTPTAGRPLHGATEVARFFLGLRRLYGPERMTVLRLEDVNGRLGLVTPGTDGRFPARVTAFTVVDGRVASGYDVAHPDKLRGVRIPDWNPVAPAARQRSTENPSDS